MAVKSGLTMADLIENMNENELKLYLDEHGIGLTITSTLQSEAVEGKFFLRLTDDQMRNMGLKMGHVLKLSAFLEEAKVTFIRDVSGGETTTFGPVTLRPNSTRQSVESPVASPVASGSAAPKEVDNSSGIPSSSVFFEFVDSYDSYGSPPAGSSSYNAQDSSPALSNSSNARMPPASTKYSSKLVQDFLCETTQGRALFESALSLPHGSVEYNKNRCAIVRLCTVHLYQTKGFFPTSAVKEELANAIVEAIPSFGPASNFFNRKTGTGFLEARLKQERNVQDQHARGPRPKKQKLDESLTLSGIEGQDAEEIRSKVGWLKRAPSIITNATRIRQLMAETFKFRQEEIFKIFKSDATKTLEAYPQFVTFEYGTLLWAEFSLRYPIAGSFQVNFVDKFAKKLIARGQMEGIDFECSNDCLKSLMMLLRLHPLIARIKNTSPEQLTESFIMFIEANFDMETYVKGDSKTKPLKPDHQQQPFLFCIGDARNPMNFFLNVDAIIIPCGKDFSKAFLNLYASFHALNIHYPKKISHFYKFLDETIFKITNTLMPTNASFVKTLELT